MMIRVTSCCKEGRNSFYREEIVYANKNLISTIEYSGRSDRIRTIITMQNKSIIRVTETIDEILNMMEPST